VLTDIQEASGILQDALIARPDGERVWIALGSALKPLIARYDPGPSRQLAALIAATQDLPLISTRSTCGALSRFSPKLPDVWA